MNKYPVKKSHTVRRLMRYVGKGYGVQFVLVLLCILVSATASVSGSLFLGSLIDDYITPCWPWTTRCLTGCSEP